MPKKISLPYEPPEIKHNEWWASGKLNEWINEVCKSKGLRYKSDIERGIARKRADILIFHKPKKPVCEIEVKPPSWDPLKIDLVQDAFSKADRINAPYFATWNINKLILFNTSEYDKTKSLRDGIIQIYDVAAISLLKEIEETEHKIKIKTFLEKFLDELLQIYEKKKVTPKIPIDEYFISHLHSTINALTNSYREVISDKAEKDLEFKKEIKNWFNEQAWSFTFGTRDEYSKISRQAAYLLINKILFYTALQEKFDLEPLCIPEDLRSGSRLENDLKWFFNQVLRIDYETIFTTEFIDEIAFPESEEAVESVRDLINEINRHKISSIGYDFLGNLFENLIPENERHLLGQYFTNSNVVDLILRFCMQSEKDFVLDPGCGAGTFLVRAYKHKQLINPRLAHNEILPYIWGIDISKFASHLSTINLAIKDLGVKENYPRIIHSDFFEVRPPSVNKESIHFKIPEKIKGKIKGLGTEEKEIEYPEWFDAVVGNPPYTRQEEMERLSEEGYKDDLIKNALYLNSTKLAEISKRAGIHAYFFIHGYKFLKEGGRFGFIVSNSWLDVDYGKGLQEFFLKHYKILAIIESKVERWFEDADVNTCIVILEKCKNKEERNDNFVRFVYLKKQLSNFIPKAEKDWDKEVERFNEIDKLVKLILAHHDNYENDEIKINAKKQEDLWIEGYDEKENNYAGSKWGKYIRAPEIFFKILEKGKNLFVPLKEVADVKFGIKTGANEFFYLTEEEIKFWKIKKEFWCHKEGKKWVPNYVIKSPRECTGIVVKPEDLKYRILMIHKDKKDLKGTNVLKHIEYGESKGFHERPTCASRKRWYDLGLQKPPDMIWFKAFNDRVFSPSNVFNYFTSDRFYAIYLRNPNHKVNLSCALNSTLAYLIIELWGRVNLGEGALDNMTYEAASMLTINPEKLTKSHLKKLSAAFNKLSSREIGSVFSEIGADSPEEVSLEKVKPDRRELDEIIFEILDLSEEEQLEVYRAVVDLVKSRIEKAKSVSRNNNKKRVSEVDLVVKRTIDSIGGEEILKKFFSGLGETETLILPRFRKQAQIGKTLHGWQLTDGRERVFFDDKKTAEYCKILTLIGVEKVKVPEKLNNAQINALGDVVDSITGGINSATETITDSKMRNKIRALVLGKIIARANGL